MAAALQCPDRATLQRLFTQGGTAAEVENLVSHLEQCARCGEMFDELLHKDNVASSLLQPGSSGLPDSSAVQNLRERLNRLRPASAAANNTVVFGSTNTGAALPAGIPLETTEAKVSFLAPPQQADEIGRLGSYRVLKQLGAGGMGMVFLAEDTMLQRKVALKTMLPNIAVNPQARERFLREARAAAKIEHPHVITIHQVGEDNGVPFLAMPFLKGESLEDRLKRDKKLPINEAIRIICEMADGLAAAHAQGLIHRDIKPGNVWLEEQPVRSPAASAQTAAAARRLFKVKVLDFGLARLQDDTTHLTHSGAIVGTPAFMAPEQARSETVDPRADLFSLGCVLYVMLTGQRPFTGATTMALLAALALDTPKSPREVNPAVPATLSDFTLRLLAKNPQDRPASADAVLDELRNLVRAAAEARKATQPTPPSAAATSKTGSPSSASTTVRPAPAAAPAKTPLVPAPQRARTKRLVVAALALLVLIGGGVAAYQLIFKTKDGTLIVEVDGTAEVSFKNGELLIRDEKGELKYTLKPSERNKTLPPGKYLVEVASVDGLKVVTDKFEIIRDGKATVRVTVDAAAAATKKDDDPERRTAEWILKQGGWVSVSTADGKYFGDLKALAELPAQPFKVTRVNIVAGASAWKVRDEDLQRLGTLTSLQTIETWYLTSEITDAGVERFTKLPGAAQLQWVQLSCPALTDTGAAHFLRCGQLHSLWLWDSQVSDKFLSREQGLDKLLFLGLSGPNLTDAGLDKIGRFPNLERLAFSGPKITDAALEKLAGTKLKDLDVHSAPGVTSAGMRHLKNLTAIEGLTLYGTNVGDAGLKEIAGLPELANLHLAQTKVTDAGMATLARFPKLRTLQLDSVPISNAGLEKLKGAARLERLGLGGTKVTDAGLEHLKAFTKLTYLDLKVTKVTADGVKKLAAALPGCKILWDGGTIEPSFSPDAERKVADWVLSIGGKVKVRVGDKEYDFIAAAKDLPAGPLRVLAIDLWRSAEVNDAGLARLKTLSSLETLWLGQAPVTNAGLAHLKTLTSLHSLTVGGTQFDDAGLEHLKDLPNLSSLWLTGSNVSNAGLERLKSMTKLANLHLGGTKVNDAGLAHLRGLTKLYHLMLQGTSVTDAGLEQLKPLTNLGDLHLSQTTVGDTGLERLKTLTNLQVLGLDATKVTDTGLEHLKALSKLKELNLKATKVTADGVKKLAAALPGCKILWDGGTIEPSSSPDADRKAAEWVLSVGGGIAIEPWQPIKDVKDLPAGQFRVVNVGFPFEQQNKVDDASLVNLRGLTELRSLGLIKTQISDAGLMHIKDLPKLDSLNLHGTRITDAGLATIKGLTRLKYLAVDFTDVTDAGLVHVEAMANLEDLHIIFTTKITEKGLIQFKTPPKLRYLGISLPLNDRVTAYLKGLPNLTALAINHQPNDDCLTHLEALPRLSDLFLDGSQVSNAGLARLRVLPNLVLLSLRGTPVGDAGVEHLKTLTKLTSLYLGETKVTAAGIDVLKKALPKCKIEWDGGTIEPKK